MNNSEKVDQSTPAEICKILNEDYSNEFDELCKNRVVQSHFKYGSVKENYSNGLIEAIPSAEICIEKFKATGNKEYLCDAANYLRFEFMFSQHPNAHFRATSSEESAGIVGISINEITEKYP